MIFLNWFTIEMCLKRCGFSLSNIDHSFFAFPHRELRLPRNSLQSIMHADDNVAPNWEIGHGGRTDEALSLMPIFIAAVSSQREGVILHVVRRRHHRDENCRPSDR